MKVKYFLHEGDFLNQLLQDAVAEINQVFNDKNNILIGLSGGNTPKHFYQRLGEIVVLPWENLYFYSIDERFIPLNDERSNFKMINSTLFAGAIAKNFVNHFYYFETELGKKECLEDFEKRTKKRLKNGMDLVFLGLGSDGHFASIFPNTDLMNHSDFVFATETEQFVVRERLTMSAELIMKSKKIMVLLSGKEKMQLIKQIENSEINSQFPSSILKNHPDITFYQLES